MIKIEASGDGYLIRGKEISQKIYEHFKDDNDLLEHHVTQYEDDSIPEEISIGIHDDCDEMTVYGMQLNSSSLEVDCNGKIQTIEITEENIIKLGINCKIESVTLQNFIKEKEGYFFIAYEAPSGNSEEPLEIPDEKIFDPKKLSLTITNLKSVYEVQAITYLEYDGKEIETRINGSGDLTEFKVLNV